MEKRPVIMVVFLILIFIFGFSSGFSASSATADRNDLTAAVKGNNAFAFDLYETVAAEKGNLFFSPFSISAALAMTYAGARGETAKQMEKTLHFDLAAARLHPGFAGLMKKFNVSGKSYQLSVANALWGQKGTGFYPAFMEITGKYYDAGFKRVDYIRNTEGARRTINDWVEAKTNHKIKELIKPHILNALTRLVLTNAIYFKGRWERQFKPAQTEEAPFYITAEQKANVPLMHQLGKFKYAETDQLQILELPYTGDKIAMDILLPKAQSGLAKLESALQPADFDSCLDKLAVKQVDVFLPRFKMEQGLTLNSHLRALGMKDAFDENKANFSGMSDTSLYITHVIHKAFVEVNEEGTEAAAATAVVMGTKSVMIDKPVTFRADHPFIFLIRDIQSGSILFMGRLIDPK
jgi:serpin B